MSNTEDSTYVEGFHATTNTTFTEFRDDRFAFFFIDPTQAEFLANMLAVEYGASRVLSVRVTGRVIDTQEALALWNATIETPPDEHEKHFIYSMLCHETREFPPEDVSRFLLAFREQGIVAVRYSDYSQKDYNDDAEAIAVAIPAAISIVHHTGYGQ